MNIKINNKSSDTQCADLAALAAELELPQKGVAVAINNRMVPRTEWQATALAENDNVVIIKAACGG